MRAQASPPEWNATFDHMERAWIGLKAISRAVRPLGDVTVPSEGQVEELVARHERDEAIRGEFNGRNYEALAEKHRLTVRQIRRITDQRRCAR